MNGDQKNIALKDYNDERKHLEGLLKDRLNFYLVYASLFVIGSLRLKAIDPELYFSVLVAGAVVSFLIATAVWRTYVLVREALKEIRKHDCHPYTSLSAKVWLWRYDANKPLLAIPFLLTSFFVYLICVSWPC